MVEIKVSKKTFSRSKVAIADPVVEDTDVAEDDHNDQNDQTNHFVEDDNHYVEDADDRAAEDEFLAALSAPNYEADVLRATAATQSAKEDAVIAKKSAKEAKVPRGRASQVAARSVGAFGATDDDLFSPHGTPLLGRDRLVLLQKVKQYKTLFPDKLKSFKLKKEPSAAELQSYLDEMEILVSVSSVDEFLTDSILSSIKIIEGVSANTKNYDISGLSMMLKMNKNFHNLCKQLFIKYGCFANVPPEYQLTMIVTTTAYICTQKNKNKDKINSFLDQPVGATENVV